jgi:hypothetical protein
MGPWGPLQRQLMAYLARHPQFQKAVKNASQRVAAHPTFQSAKQRVNSTFEKAGEKATHGASSAGQGATGGAKESTFNQWKRKSAEQWQKHMVKAMSFIFANIMTLVVLIQFGPMLWHYCKRCVRYLTNSNPAPDSEHGERRRRKRNEKAAEGAEAGFQVEAPDDSMRKAILQSVPQPERSIERAKESVSPPASSQPQWGQSSSLFDDTVGVKKGGDVQQTFNDMHKDVFRAPNGEMQIDFNTSFLVKMGDETTFTSSLEREGLTGSISSRS